LQKDSEEMSKK